MSIKQEYKTIEPDLLQAIKGDTWSIENMAAHGAASRNVSYIGSRINGDLDNDRTKGKLIYDYYRDTAGAYWFGNRALLPDGEIISMERYLFGGDKRRAQTAPEKQTKR